MAEQTLAFYGILERTQEYISKNYAASLIDPQKRDQVKPYIEQFLRQNDIRLDNMDFKELVNRIFREMTEYSILTPWLTREDVEEINVNGWDDIAITYTTGAIVKLKEHFNTPQHAIDIVKRLLDHSKMVIDDAMPMAQGHLPNNSRITALKEPLVDPDRGIAVSIRLLHPNKVNKEQIIRSGEATSKMFDFMAMCLRYGVSFVVAGATGSGKTTLLNALLATIPDTKRVFSIESGSRELALVRRDEEGNVINNVVHTLSRPSDTAANSVEQEDLVVASLRFDPDIIAVGEMRDTEAYAAVEASLTGHTVVSTIHAFAADAAHTRLALLTQKKFPIDFKTSLMQAGQAFPVVIHAHKLEDNSRRVMDISECIVDGLGNRTYSTLFRYVVDKNDIVNGEYVMSGHFEAPNLMSESLERRLINAGVPYSILEKFLVQGVDYR